MRFTKLAILAVLTVFLNSSFLAAQSASTSLRGTVTDATGAAVRGASVHIVNADNGTIADTTSSSAGEYTFQQLQPGRYTVTVSAAGFGNQVLKARLLVATPATVNAKLNVSADTVTVDVSAATQTINTTDASLGNSLGTEMIMALPSEGRRIEALLSLQPGVLYLGENPSLLTSADSRNGVVSGARADQTNLTLDGLDNNDQIAPIAFTGVLRVPEDAVQEFRVTTSNANADTGRSSGGQANVITRSGTNELHGALYEYNRNNWGEANDWFNKQQELGSGDPNIAPKLIRNTYGARLGGPILKDKLFFFGNYEGQRTDEAGTVQRTVPNSALRQGTVTYNNSGGGISTLNSSQIAGLDDPACVTNGTCPWGVGADPNTLALMQAYPSAKPGSANLSVDPLNLDTLTFSSPKPEILNTYVARMDFNPGEKHRLFVRALMMNDTTSALEYYPGQGPSSKSTNNSKGIGGGYTWIPNANFVNTVRYGYTRQSSAITGSGHGAYTEFRQIDPPESTSRTSTTLVPLHNVTDDLSYTKGRNTIQAGFNWRHFDYINTNDDNSWDSALLNAEYLNNASIAGTGGPLDPGDVDPNDGFNYDNAVVAVAGLVPQVTNVYNYKVSADGATGTLLPQGASVDRDYRVNEFEWYIQDAWKPVSNLTVTFGLRHTILQTPWEKNGQQVQPTINLHNWFATRAAQSLQGNTVQPDIQFAASGKAHNSKPFYPMNWGNFAPRLAIAFSPAPDEGWLQKLTGGAGKTSIRAGFGMYYDHFGEGIVDAFSRYGSFSLATQLSNTGGSLDVAHSPRFTGLHDIPAGLTPAQGPVSYPYGLAPGSYASTYGLDDQIKTPYSEVVDFSIQREFKGGFTLEASYVGRFGRHLLQQLDLAQPLDLVDKSSGMDYYTAMSIMDKAYDAGANSIPDIPYFENIFPAAKGMADGSGATGNSATTNIYNLQMLQGLRGNETTILQDLDSTTIDDPGCNPLCGIGPKYRFLADQYASLFAWSSIGMSSYNAGQVTLRHPMSHGFDFDISYTYSKSMDMGSETETNSTQANAGTSSYNPILDAFNPRKSYGLSDFNTKHLVNADWVIQLPYGRGHRFGSDIPRLMDTLVGGWELSGIARLSSGLPFGIGWEGWNTNWQLTTNMVQTAPIKTKRNYVKDPTSGALLPQAFADPSQFDLSSPNAAVRIPYAGEVGNRNNFVGDGYFSVDAGLHKSFPIFSRYHFDLAWEAFNISNSVRFDSHSLQSNLGAGAALGLYTATLTDKRKMQFSGRFEF